MLLAIFFRMSMSGVISSALHGRDYTARESAAVMIRGGAQEGTGEAEVAIQAIAVELRHGFLHPVPEEAKVVAISEVIQPRTRKSK